MVRNKCLRFKLPAYGTSLRPAVLTKTFVGAGESPPRASFPVCTGDANRACSKGSRGRNVPIAPPSVRTAAQEGPQEASTQTLGRGGRAAPRRPRLGLCVSDRSSSVLLTPRHLFSQSSCPDPHVQMRKQAGADREHTQGHSRNSNPGPPESRDLAPARASLESNSTPQPRLGAILEGGDSAGAPGRGGFKR